jgi:zinc transport system ATP-binding protein
VAEGRPPAVAAHEVCFSYPGVQVIDHLDLVLEEGDFMGVLGPNGGGKTTFIKLILGLLEPSCGSIDLFGTPLKEFKDWHLIGYVPQTATSFDRRFPITVEEVVAMGRTGKAGFLGKLTGEDRRIVRDSMEKVGISDLSHRLIGRLSGGQQQRAFIARALASQPRLHILDEPTAGVDVESNDRFYNLLRDLNRGGLTIMLVSHDIGTVTKNANKVACIAGKLLFHCPAPELSDERIRQVFGSQQVIHHHHGGEHNAP